MKTLKELFDIKKGDVVSITGTGGKTSLLFTLGNELRKKSRVLITTSTKILMPSKEYYDFIYPCIDDYIRDKMKNHEGATVISSKYIKEEKKLIGISDEDLESVMDDFDVVLIEADGSKMLPLKAWKDHEPPILRKTTKTIGVFPIDMLGEKINQDNIYNYEGFIKFTEGSLIVYNETVGRICSSPDGIFKNSRGSLYLFINRADDSEKIQTARKLAEYLKTNAAGNAFDFKICTGSLKEGVYYEC
ncbi:MAG: selenium cofactor biosynthesis protein YqeC [Sedimentibacter saalensis]|uniref:selenium cofactor biosynthesis protein YqeC n=1 Tax=Sedimentibacter saalensis TaxID=130788 RepID=UPI0031594FE4